MASSDRGPLHLRGAARRHRHRLRPRRRDHDRGRRRPLAPALYHADHHALVPRVDNPGYIPALRGARRGARRAADRAADRPRPGAARAAGARRSARRARCPSRRSAGDAATSTSRTASSSGTGSDRRRAGSRTSARRRSLPVLVKAREGLRLAAHLPGARPGRARLLPRLHDRPTRSCRQLCRGEEFSIDVFCDLEGRCLNAIPRTMIESKGGESIKGMTIKDAELIEHGASGRRDAAASSGPANIQCFREPDGSLPVTDVNPRFGGAFPLPTAAGSRYPELALALANGERPEPRLGEFREGVMMTRFFSQRVLTPGRTVRLVPFARGAPRAGRGASPARRERASPLSVLRPPGPRRCVRARQRHDDGSRRRCPAGAGRSRPPTAPVARALGSLARPRCSSPSSTATRGGRVARRARRVGHARRLRGPAPASRAVQHRAARGAPLRVSTPGLRDAERCGCRSGSAGTSTIRLYRARAPVADVRRRRAPDAGARRDQPAAAVPGRLVARHRLADRVPGGRLRRRRLHRQLQRHGLRALDAQRQGALATTDARREDGRRRPRSSATSSSSTAWTATSGCSTAATAALLWRFRVGSPVESSPVVRDGVDYFGAWNGRVYALDLQRRQLRWSYALAAARSPRSAAIAGGTLYIGDYGGRLLALVGRERRRALGRQRERAHLRHAGGRRRPRLRAELDAAAR